MGDWMMMVAAGMLALAGLPPATEDGGVTVVARPPTGGANAFYVGNRPPLEPSPLIKLPIGAIEPKGWLRGQLELMRDGMTGHMAELSHWVKPEGNAWLSKDGKGENGWEELPYWLKGYGDLGYVLKEEQITARAKWWMDGVMAAQREDGYFGSEENRGGGPENMQLGAAGKLKGPDLWPQMPMMDALKSYHEATGDKRVLEFLSRYFKWEAALPKEQLLPASWQKLRGGDNLESVLWLYNRTGEAWLLDLARTLQERTSPWSEKIASWHGVNICQGFREPGVFWQFSKDKKDLEAVERNYREVMGLYGQVPGGMFGADENCRAGYGDPRQAAETCSMVEFMNSFEQMLRFTGDGRWADRCEEVAFNSLPAAFTADCKALHYLTSPNMVQLDKESKAPGLANEGTMISYDPGEVYRCCQHNHAMGWPYFAEHLWMATSDNGLAAVMYAESEVRARVGAGAEVRLTEETGYPFGETVRIAVHLDKPAKFPIYLRAPYWAGSALVTVTDKDLRQLVQGGFAAKDPYDHGAYDRIERVWHDGEVIQLELPMQVRVKEWPSNSRAVSVQRGPLWYSLRIGEDQRSYGAKPWSGTEVFAASAWNYGLELNAADPPASFRVVRTRKLVGDQPFTLDTTPIVLEAKARRIANWTQDRRGLVGLLEPSPIRSTEPAETIQLIPMGAARLRISAFPVIGTGPSAHDWPARAPPRHTASHEHDDIDAVSDGKEPKSSNDQSIPRFTWWDHVGTTEWITYSFDTPRRVSRCAVYWFDDTGAGRCRVPASWKVLYKDGDSWKDVVSPTAAGAERDRFNEVRFNPVLTAAVKIEVRLQDRFSGGILEWKIDDAK